MVYPIFFAFAPLLQSHVVELICYISSPQIISASYVVVHGHKVANEVTLMGPLEDDQSVQEEMVFKPIRFDDTSLIYSGKYGRYLSCPCVPAYECASTCLFTF